MIDTDLIPELRILMRGREREPQRAMCCLLNAAIDGALLHLKCESLGTLVINVQNPPAYNRRCLQDG